MKNGGPLLRLEDVSKRYDVGDQPIWALRSVNLCVAPGEFISIVGPSGSGKSTLLNVAGGIDSPTCGQARVGDLSLRFLSSRRKARLRRESVAFVLQSSNLFLSLTAEGNVSVPLRARRMKRKETAARVAAALAAVGMSHRAHHYPEQLSGGELQRVAIARALATNARLLLVDEPTGNLDTLRSEEILELLKQTTEKRDRSVVLVTHDLRAAAYGDRIITLRDGQIVDDTATNSRAEIIELHGEKTPAQGTL